MMRLCPDGMARLGGYGIPKSFDRRPDETQEVFVERCAQAFRETAQKVMDGAVSIDLLVSNVRQFGIGTVATSTCFIAIPALAPLNGKMGGAAGSPSEATWTRMLSHPLLLLFAPSSGTAFSTATTSLRPEGARVQQALRVVGSETFCVAAASAGLPFANWPGGPEALLADVRCPACRRAHHAAAGVPQAVTLATLAQTCGACPGCMARLERLHGLLDAGARCVVAAREHAQARSKGLLTWCGTEGRARAQRVRAITGLAWDEDGVADASSLDRVVWREAGIKRQLRVWGAWVCRLAHALHGKELVPGPTTFKVFVVFRLFRLAPFVKWAVGAETGARTKKSAAIQQARLDVINKMADVLDGANKELLDFVKRVMKVEGEQIH
jgi:hypothetical protein